MITCPVCNQGMIAGGVNPNIYQCQRTKEYVPELKTKLDIIHATYYIDPVTQQITYKVIELGSVSFVISDDVNGKKTIIRRVKELPRKKGESRRFESQELLKLPAAINLPWHDRKQVMEKLSLYLLFS